MSLATTDLLVTLVIGGIVGWLASLPMRTNGQMGICANVVLGIIGSYVGAFVAKALGVQANTRPATWIVAVLGAALLIGILRAAGILDRLTRMR